MRTKTNVAARPANPAAIPRKIESCPNVAETVLVSSIATGVWSGFSITLARFFAEKIAVSAPGLAASVMSGGEVFESFDLAMAG